MFTFHIEQSTIAYSAQIILALSFSLYLLSLKNKTAANTSLFVFALSLAITVILSLLTQSMVQSESLTFFLYASLAKNLVNIIEVIALLRFAYSFPYPLPGQRLEKNLILGGTTLLGLGNIGLTVYNVFSSNFHNLNPLNANSFLFTAFLGLVFVLLRQTVHFSHEDERQTKQVLSPWWQAIFRPQGLIAKASQTLALIFMGFEVLQFNFFLFFLPVDKTALVNFLALQGLLFALFVVYLNRSFEASSLLLKIIGASLMTTLTALGVVSWLVGSSLQTTYRNPNFLTDQQTLHFAPNAQGGYTVTKIPFHFNSKLGTKLELWEEVEARVKLPFSFPFYNQPWQEAHVSRDGIVSFGESLSPPMAFSYLMQTVIAVFPTDFRESKIKNVFFNSEAERVIFTWDGLSGPGRKEANTFQLVLYKDGALDLIYKALDQGLTYSTIALLDAPYFIGIVPGTAGAGRKELNFSHDLPYIGSKEQALVQTFYFDFRRYMHMQILPFGYAVLASTIFILFGFPFFFNSSLVQPLKVLVHGMKEVKAGNLTVKLPVQTQDEIGFLTQAFNSMVKAVKSSVEIQQKLTIIEQELVVAKNIQQSLLPHPKPAWKNLVLIGYNQAAREVGGDFYQYHAFPSEGRKGKYALAVGDVSGKGVSAALLMAICLSRLDASFIFELSPAERLAYLDEVISPYTKPKRQNCALCYVELELDPQGLAVVSIVNAGGIPPYIKRQTGEVANPEVGGFALGQGLGMKVGYQTLTLNLAKGDLLILTSDGVVEAYNEQGEMLGFERTLAMILAGPTEAEAMLSYLEREIHTFMGATEPHDDITVVVLQI